MEMEMVVEENLYGSLPSDIMIEIFSRLPSKSIARFRCLSKLWASTLTPASPYFSELFLTQSRTRPGLVFAVQKDNNEWCLYSCPQLPPHMSDKNSNSLSSVVSVTAEFHMTLPETLLLSISAPILGLIYCSLHCANPMLCNPSTRHLLQLPQLTRASSTFLGYDPIDKQFSLVAISSNLEFSLKPVARYQILKLGGGGSGNILSWRDIECPLRHYAHHFNTCINGILYYIASFGVECPSKIACFDLNSEKFKFIDQPRWSHRPDILVNFKGKLSGINTKWVKFSKNRFNFQLTIRVLEDIETQTWSKHVYVLSSRWNKKREPYFVAGVTREGDIVLSMSNTTHPLYVYFFNLEKNILRKVEIKGVEAFKFDSFLLARVDYVEHFKDLN